MQQHISHLGIVFGVAYNLSVHTGELVDGRGTGPKGWG